MNKEEHIKRYGKVAYEKMLQQTRDWYVVHREEANLKNKKWREAHPDKVKTQKKEWCEVNPDKVIASNHEGSRKGGKYYEKMLIYKHTGLQGERNKIRWKHAKQYRPYKQLIAPDSEIQHEWLPGTAKYRGVALVEKDQHRHGIIKVIKVLEGKITLFTEKEIAEQGGN